jgi:hypothetical protein
MPQVSRFDLPMLQVRVPRNFNAPKFPPVTSALHLQTLTFLMLRAPHLAKVSSSPPFQYFKFFPSLPPYLTNDAKNPFYPRSSDSYLSHATISPPFQMLKVSYDANPTSSSSSDFYLKLRVLHLFDAASTHLSNDAETHLSKATSTIHHSSATPFKNAASALLSNYQVPHLSMLQVSYLSNAASSPPLHAANFPPSQCCKFPTFPCCKYHAFQCCKYHTFQKCCN